MNEENEQLTPEEEAFWQKLLPAAKRIVMRDKGSIVGMLLKEAFEAGREGLYSEYDVEWDYKTFEDWHSSRFASVTTQKIEQEADNYRKEVEAWVKSEEGQKHLQEGMEKAKQMSDELRKASKINTDDLNRPTTI